MYQFLNVLKVVCTQSRGDSLVSCEAHLPHVPPASSIQGGGHTVQQTSLVSVLQTTGENMHGNNTVIQEFIYLKNHITLLTTTLVHVQNRVWGERMVPVCH